MFEVGTRWHRALAPRPPPLPLAATLSRNASRCSTDKRLAARDHGAELGVRQRKRNQGSAVEVLDFALPLVKHGRASRRNGPPVRWWARATPRAGEIFAHEATAVAQLRHRLT